MTRSFAERFIPHEATSATSVPHSLPNNDTQKPMNNDEHGFLESDPELEGLTLYEKKSVLVNRDLDAQGMGKYQWCIFLLCGLGYFLDLMWAQAFSLIVSSMKQEFGFSESAVGNIFSSFNAGLCAGAFVWGILVDVIGRYWAFNFTVLWSSVFGLALAGPNSYNAVLVLTAFIGIGIGGNVPIDSTITLEFLPKNRRWLLPALSVFQPLGVVVSSLICYGFIPNYSCVPGLDSCNFTEAGQPCCAKADNWGWRYVMLTLGSLTLLVFVSRFVLFKFQESPKYLLYRGQDEKAVKALQYIARFNKKSSGISMETFATLEGDTASVSSGGSDVPIVMRSGSKRHDLAFNQITKMEFERLKLLFNTSTMTRVTLLVWVIYMFDYWGFTIAGNLLPRILLKKGTELGLTPDQTYRSYVYIYIFGIPGVILGASIYRFRFISMFLSSILFGACLFIFTVVHDQASYIGVNGLVYFFQSMFNAILYGMTPEFFPAPIRGTACGVASFWGRVFGIISPLAAGAVLPVSDNGVLYMAGAGVFICPICIALLPRKLWGAQPL